MTPRRSSRARIQPSPAVLPHSQSSSSTNSLTRAGERNTRLNHKFASPQRSTTQRSQSIDDPDPATKNDLPQTRQRQRAREDDNDEVLRLTGAEDEDDDAEEDEVTRCICGQQDYPGLPPSRRQDKTVVKDDPSLHLSTDASDLLQDEIGSMFIQCDTCKVWQHGGCVGIMDEAMSPEEYFCEECRKDLHKIINESNGCVHEFSVHTLPSPFLSLKRATLGHIHLCHSKPIHHVLFAISYPFGSPLLLSFHSRCRSR
jgi:PHD-finger